MNNNLLMTFMYNLQILTYLLTHISSIKNLIKKIKCQLTNRLYIYFVTPVFTPKHSCPSKLVQIPDCPRHSWHTNSNQTQQNSCQAWLNLPYLQPRSTIKVNRVFLSLVLSTLIKKQDIALNW